METRFLSASANTGIGLWTSICVAFANVFGVESNNLKIKQEKVLNLAKNRLLAQVKGLGDDYEYKNFSVSWDQKLSVTVSVIAVKVGGVQSPSKLAEKSVLSTQQTPKTASSKPDEPIIVAPSHREKREEPRSAPVEKKENEYTKPSFDKLIDTKKQYIEPVQYNGVAVYWNNHSHGDYVALDKDFNGIPKGTIGIVLGITKDMLIDVQFDANGKPFVVSVLNQYITNLTLTGKLSKD